ncbi:MAG: KTSC domain-containing protein [Elusimicrobia bacterium]|nr:KTSC domain-containing protein [Elusimicrobiota bacterium]
MVEVIRQRSSFIAETRYDKQTETLEIEFTDGATFRYDGVPRSTYTAFITSPSRGRAFHTLIKPRFEGEQV